MANMLEQIEYEESTVRSWKLESKSKGTDAAENKMVQHRLIETAEGLKELAADLSGTKGRYNKILADSVIDEDWITVAYIGVTQVFQAASSTNNSLQMAINGIGSQIEEHYKLTLFEKENKKETDSLKAALKKRNSKDVNHSRKVLWWAMKKRGVTWESWDIHTKCHIGARVLKVVLDVYQDIFEVEEVIEGKKTRNKIKVSLDFTNWKTAFLEYRSGWFTPPMPLKIEPIKWGEEIEGGFYTERMKVKKVKCRGKVHENLIKSMPEVDEALNKQQGVAWVVNKGMLTRVQEILNSGAYKDIKDLAADRHTELDESLKVPKEDRTPEITNKIRDWKHKERDAYQSDRKVASRMLKVSRVVKTAQELKDWDEFYFVYNCDLVGRMYCNSVGLNTQGGDLEKSLLDFKKKYKVTKDGRKWLRITAAKYFGVKGTEEELLRWFSDHEEVMKAVKDDWSVNFWTKAKKPWLFLRMCTEAFEEHSGMPIPLDGVCNGLQHYAALMRCKRTARNLGMITDKPSDVYTMVQEKLEKKYGKQEWLTRDFTKKPVMLIAYGVTKQATKRSIWLVLQRWMSYEVSNEVGEDLWSAMIEVIGAAIQGMEILKLEYTGGYMTWESPTGFTCYQPYDKEESITISLSLSKTVRMQMKKGTGVCNTRKQKSAYPANKVHSMDAAHAVRIVNNTKTEIRCTHDEFAVHCNKVTKLQETIADEFIKLYKDIKIQEGDLDLESIRGKKYFFC